LPFNLLEMTSRLHLPDPPASERTPLVEALLGQIEQLIKETLQQAETIQQLRNEIAVLKGEKGKPTFKASGMDEATDPNDDEVPPGDGDEADRKPRKRPGSAKRNKTVELTIHQEIHIAPAELLPMGARFKGYQDVVIQDLRIEPVNTRYRLEVWETAEGQYLRGVLPDHLRDRRFGPELRRFVCYQHHHCQVTQPLLYEQLREWGVDISVGQIDALLSQHNEVFFAEKDQILVTGLAVSQSITVDDSGARHQGQNGYVTQIGNEHFAWFASTSSKSRINFLELLHAESIRYALNEHTLDYWTEQNLPQVPCQQLQAHWPGPIEDPECWEALLDGMGIHNERHRRIATEGALLGGLIDKGFSLDLVIVSDGAGQFAILLHALCWVHAERLVHKLIPLNGQQREDQERVRGEIWDLYRDLKRYQADPDPAQAPTLTARFDQIFTQRTSFETLNRTLKRLHGHKEKLLLVLQRPDIPLHTNGSENDIRGYVKWRKVSGGTRSDLGRRCRDSFASLKKTCRKLGISFWDYLADRIERKGDIPPLPEIIRQRAVALP
jgi:Transposase IS66 family